MKHKHHIIPRHKGGSDDPSNLIELSVKEHCLWHWCEWQRTKDPKDYGSYTLLKGFLDWHLTRPKKVPPPEPKSGTREWKIKKLYKKMGGATYSILQTESVDNAYNRLVKRARGSHS